MRQSTLAFGRVQDVELTGRIEPGAEHLVAAPADNQERVACQIGVDGDDVVGERPVKAGRGRCRFDVDLVVQVHGLTHDLSQRAGVDGLTSA